MGMIKIQVMGSFGKVETKQFTAMTHGHANAVNEAIRYLTDLQRNAIALDHKLQKEDAEPECGWEWKLKR